MESVDRMCRLFLMSYLVVHNVTTVLEWLRIRFKFVYKLSLSNFLDGTCLKLNYVAYNLAPLDDTSLRSWQRNTLYNFSITHVFVQCRPDLEIVKLLVISYEIVFLAV